MESKWGTVHAGAALAGAASRAVGGANRHRNARARLRARSMQPTSGCPPPGMRIYAWERTSTLPDMCRNIHTLHNFDPPATHEEIRAAALQYVRKVSGFSKPSQANSEPFERAVDEVALATSNQLD